MRSTTKIILCTNAINSVSQNSTFYPHTQKLEFVKYLIIQTNYIFVALRFDHLFNRENKQLFIQKVVFFLPNYFFLSHIIDSMLLAISTFELNAAFKDWMETCSFVNLNFFTRWTLLLSIALHLCNFDSLCAASDFSLLLLSWNGQSNKLSSCVLYYKCIDYSN